MAVATGTALLAAAGATAAAGIGAAVYSASQRPDIPEPPPPTNYYSYDDEGNLETVQEWDPERNAYVTKVDPEPDKEKAPEKWAEWNDRQEKKKKEKAARDSIRQQMLSNLDKTPEERMKAYEEYAQTFSDAMHRDVDRRYKETTSAKEEEMAARGLYGSRAYVDTMAELAREKTEADLDIAERATLAKEDLAARDRNYWMNMLNQVDSGRRADALTALKKTNTAMQGAQMGSAGIMGRYAADTSNRLNDWRIKTDNARQIGSDLSNTATGLAFLYGYGGAGGSKNPSG